MDILSAIVDAQGKKHILYLDLNKFINKIPEFFWYAIDILYCHLIFDNNRGTRFDVKINPSGH